MRRFAVLLLLSAPMLSAKGQAFPPSQPPPPDPSHFTIPLHVVASMMDEINQNQNKLYAVLNHQCVEMKSVDAHGGMLQPGDYKLQMGLVPHLRPNFVSGLFMLYLPGSSAVPAAEELITISAMGSVLPWCKAAMAQ